MYKILLMSCIFVHSSICQNISEDDLIQALNRRQKEWVAGRNILNLNEIEFSCIEDYNTNPMPTTRNLETYGWGIPQHFDSRKNWPYCQKIFNSIPDQGRCANCWATSIAAGFGDRLCIATQGASIQASAEDLTTCCYDCSAKRNGCEGGSMSQALNFLMNYGIASGGHYGSYEGCKPYPKSLYAYHSSYSRTQPIPCQPSCSHFYNTPYIYDRKRIYTWQLLPAYNIPAIQRNIMAYGPVVAVYHFHEDFKYYKRGVYSSRSKEGHLSVHGINILGWGTENDLDYWLVRNTWGYGWGEMDGFFKILRGKHNGGIERQVYAMYIFPGTMGIRNSTPIKSSYSIILPNFVVLVADFLLVMAIK